MRKHREVVKFVCGLMADPRPLVDHVYTTLHEDVLGKMRTSSVMPYIDTGLLESLYQESAVPLPGSGLHNQHINYYKHEGDDDDDDDDNEDDDNDDDNEDDDNNNDDDDHDDHDDHDDDYCNHDMDDRKEKPRDTTPVFTPSKLYMFEKMKGDVTLGHKTPEPGVTGCRDPGQSEPNSLNNQECAIWIHVPDESLTERLLSLCRTISASQPVIHFCLDDRCELTEENVPIMSKEPKSLVLRRVNVSSSVLNYLLQHESLEALRLESTRLHDGAVPLNVSSSLWNYLLQHESLEVLHLIRTHLHDTAVPLIFNHRNLKVLTLEGADMYHEMCEYVCHHLGDLVHLEHIDLSYNDLSCVSSIRLSNTTSPVTLRLRYTHMAAELFKSIYHLTSVVKLKELDLSYNTLTGSLHHLLSESHQGLQSLEELHLNWTELNKNDIEALTRAVQRHVLPEFKGFEVMDQQPEHDAEKDRGADTNLCDSSSEGADTVAVSQRSV